MPNIRRTQHIRRLGTTAVLTTAFLASAIVPAVAATPTLEELDRSALTMIAIFGTLLFAIVFEVWRLSIHEQPTENHALRKRNLDRD